MLATCGLRHFPASEPSRQVLRKCFMGVRGFAFQPDSNNSQDDIFSKLGMPQNSKAQQRFVKFLGVHHLIFGILSRPYPVDFCCHRTRDCHVAFFAGAKRSPLVCCVRLTPPSPPGRMGFTTDSIASAECSSLDPLFRWVL